MQNTQQPTLLGQGAARQIRKGTPHGRLGDRELAAGTVRAQDPTQGKKIENLAVTNFFGNSPGGGETALVETRRDGQKALNMIFLTG